MPDQADLIRALERTRADYELEWEACRFRVDAYTGGGGFEGRIRQEARGYWGRAAEVYSQGSARTSGSAARAPTDSYLDRFPREDDAKYRGRVEVAHYPNYIEPIVDLRNSYLLRKPFTYRDQPDVIERWRADVDGLGTPFAQVRPGVVLDASLCGWTPTLIDRDPIPPGMTAAQVAESGLDRVRIIPLTPANLLEYVHDGRQFTWAKVRTDHVLQPTWSAPPVLVQRYTIWTPTEAIVYEVSQVEGDASQTVVGPMVRQHGFGEVPIAILRHKASPDARDKVRGQPMLRGASVAAKRLFNLLSELDEHLRQQVFAILVLSQRGQANGEISVGTDNGLTIDPESKNVHYFLAPPASIAATIEARVSQQIREIYRMGRVEYARGSSQLSSGLERRYEFAQTNLAIADFAAEVARWEQHVTRLVGTALGVAPERLAKAATIAPENFDIEDLQTEIRAALDAITIKLGATAERELRLSLVQRLLPNLEPGKLAHVEEELTTMAEEEARMRASGAALLDAAREPGEDDDEDDDPPPVDGPPPT